MVDFLLWIFIAIMAYICYTSSVMISERKRLWKEGKTDYYGNPIERKQPRCIWDDKSEA